MTETYILKIFRGHPGKQYWEEFELARTPHANIISSLMEIQRRPINRQNEKVVPIAWEAGCLEEVCGSCSILVNGYPRQACTALIEAIIAETKSNIIKVAPLSKFPLVRDLIVDRSRMFDDLKRIHGWIDVESSYNSPKPPPRISQEKQKIMYALSTCMTCGCCLEACPQVNDHSKFIGPAAISQVRLFNANPIGRTQKAARLRPLLEEGGISDCGKSQNCGEVCPKKIPLVDSIGDAFRSAMQQALQDFLSFPDRE
jgi:succinate dehydrogenase / fumarate reductase, iron-sulfur subunit